jgi:Uma2 family endonuclease
MVEIGLLDEDEPFEPIDGELLYVRPPNPSHRIVSRTGSPRSSSGPYGTAGFRVGCGNAIGGIVDSIPELDIAIVRDEIDEQFRHFRADETDLIIEVSVTSMTRDRTKAEISAAAGARVHWTVDVERAVVIEHRAPRADRPWESIREVQGGELRDPPSADARRDVATFLLAAP